MTPTRRSFFLKKYHVPGLFQIALIGTAFTALRVLESPSTLTFFVLETAAAATLGIFLSGRARENRRLSPAPGYPFDSQVDVDGLPSLARLRILASKLGVNPSGGVGDLQVRIKSAVRQGRHSSGQDGVLDRTLGSVVAYRLVPMVRDSGVPFAPSSGNGYRSSLADEGSRLLALAHDLKLESASYRRTLRMTRKASQSGRMDKAVILLEDGNHRLRARLGSLIGQDLETEVRGSDRVYLAASSAFFVLVALSLWALSTALYVAPPIFYVLVAGAAGATALNAYWSGDRRTNGILLQIVLLAALLKFHFFYLNPYLYTSDAFYHFLGVQGIAKTGRVPETLGHYTYFPVHHIFGFIGSSVAGLPITWYGLFAFAAQLVAIPAAFLIGREIANPRVGLFAALLTTFSVFFFLPTIPLPSLFGFGFIFLALYALIVMRRSGSQAWFAVFWLSALCAFFSHPITALALFLILLVRFTSIHAAGRRRPEPRASTVPVLSYGVVYAGYLALLAIISLETFARTFFAPTFVPPLATSPTELLQASSLYVLESALAPSNIAILFFFASYGMLSRAGINSAERRFLALLGVAFILIPALEFIFQNFRGQTTRFTSYIIIPLVLIGAHGAVRAFSFVRGGRRTASIMVTLFVAFAFVGASSYLTSNDARYIYSEIPAIPTHITESALSSRNFLTFTKEGTFVYMDFGSWIYFLENNERARDALLGLHTGTLDEFRGTRQAFVVVNEHFIPYGNPYEGTLFSVKAVQSRLEDLQSSRVFDAGEVQLYMAP